MIFTEAAAASLRRISGTVAATVDRKFFKVFFISVISWEQSEIFSRRNSGFVADEGYSDCSGAAFL